MIKCKSSRYISLGEIDVGLVVRYDSNKKQNQ